MPDSDGVILFEADLDQRDLMEGLRSIGKGLGRLEDQSKKTSKRVDTLSKSTKKLSTIFKTIATGYIINQVARIGSAAVDVAKKYELLDVRMQTAFQGSAEAAQYAIGWTRNFATSVPASLETVTDKFVLLQTAGLDPLQGSMQSLFDVTNKAGGGLKRLDAITGATAKAFIAGKMQQEEFNRFVDAGVPAVNLLADALKVTTSRIFDMSRKGEIGRDKIKLLIDEMGRWASGASLDMMQSTVGKLTNVTDAIEAATVSFMDKGALDGFKLGIDGIIAAIGELESSGKIEEIGAKFGTFVNTAAEKIPDIVKGIGNVLSVAEDLIPVAKTVGEAMLLMWSIGKLREFTSMLTGIPSKLGNIRSSATAFDKLVTGVGAGVIVGQALARLLDEIATEHLEAGFTPKLDESMATMWEWKAAIETSTEVSDSFAESLKKVNEETARASLPEWLTGKEGHLLSVSAPVVDVSGLEEFEKNAASADRWLQWLAETEKSMKAAEAAGRKLTKSEQALYKVLAEKAKKQKELVETEKKQQDHDLTKARILTEFKLAYDDLARGIEESKRRQDEWNESANSGEAKADALLLVWQGLEYQAKDNAYWDDYWSGKIGNLSSMWDDARMTFSVPIEPDFTPPPEEKVDAIWESVRASATNHLAGLMTDLLRGDTDALQTFYDDLFSEIADNAAQELQGIFTNILSGKKPGGEGELTGIMDLFSGEDAGNMWKNVGAVIGGGMMEHAKKKKNVWGAVVGGAIQGFVAYGGVWGAVIGAVMGYLSTRGGEKTPQTILTVSAAGAQAATRHQGPTDSAIDTATRQLMVQYSATELGLRDMIKGFGDVSLMEMLSTGLPAWATEGAPQAYYSAGPEGLANTGQFTEGSLQSFVDYLTQGGLMQAFMEQRYAPLMLQGLSNAGMDEKYIETIMGQIGQLTSGAQVEAMNSLVSAATGVKRAEEQGYGGLREQALLSPTEALWSNLSQINDQMTLSVTGLESMRPADRIAEWENLSRSMDTAGNSIGQFLQQLQALGQGIHDQALGLIEQLDLQHMGSGEKAQYFMNKIREINNELGKATDKGQIEKLSSQAFSYQQQLAGLFQSTGMGSSLFGMGGQTMEDWLREQIVATDVIAQERIAALEAVAQGYYQEMLDKVAFFGETIGIAGETILGFVDLWMEKYGGPNGTGPPSEEIKPPFGRLTDPDPTEQTPWNPADPLEAASAVESGIESTITTEFPKITAELQLLRMEILLLRQFNEASDTRHPDEVRIRVEPEVNKGIEVATTEFPKITAELQLLRMEILLLRQFNEASDTRHPDEVRIRVEPEVNLNVNLDANLQSILKQARAEAMIVARDQIIRWERSSRG